MHLPDLVLKKNEERRLRAGHLWVFSNEVDTQKSDLKAIPAGALVRVVDSRGQPKGLAFYSRGSLICARLLTRDVHVKIGVDWFVKRIQQALLLRQRLFRKPFYRLVFGESDGLPGLVIDRFGSVCSVQANIQGMDQMLPDVLDALKVVVRPATVVIRNDSKAREYEQLASTVSVLGAPIGGPVQIEENGVKFLVDPVNGQKTGWFYDHRDTRAWVSRHVDNLRVLDVFTYTGAFAVQAASNGASEVVAIDASGSALERLRDNALLNGVADRITTTEGDAFQVLKDLVGAGEQFDVVIVDPPAFIPRKKDLKRGAEAYQRVNQLALQLLKPGGIGLSASCSMHLSFDALRNIVRRALLKRGYTGQIIHHAMQAADHPVHPAIPETSYLKGMGFRMIMT